MFQYEFLAISALRALVEVAGYALLGQGLLAFLAGMNRENNFVYRLLLVVTNPVIRVVRVITPRFILDRHIPFLAFLLLVWLWLGLAMVKRYICVAHGVNC